MIAQVTVALVLLAAEAPTLGAIELGPAQGATALIFFAAEGVDPSTAQATFAAVKARVARDGIPAADLTTEHHTLLSPKLFVDFTVPSPKFLPQALAAPWKAGSDACAKQVGPTGPELAPGERAAAAAAARLCQDALGAAIWELYLEQRKVTRAVSVVLRSPGRDGVTYVLAMMHEPGLLRRRGLRLEKLSAERVAPAAAKAVAELLGGGGGFVSDAPRTPLPSVGVPALEAGPFETSRPIEVPPSCTGLPGRLEVFPPGPFTRAMEAAYRTVPAEKRTGKPKRCDVVLYPGYESAPTRVVHARLSCPPAQHRSMLAASAGAGLLISDLVERAVISLCTRPQ